MSDSDTIDELLGRLADLERRVEELEQAERERTQRDEQAMWEAMGDDL